MLNLLERTLLEFHRGLAFITAALILFMGVLITADVVGRNIGWFVIPWSAEATEYGLYLSAVLIAPWLLRHGHHVSVDILMQMLSEGAARLLIRVGDMLLLAVCSLLCWYTLAALLRSHGDGSIVIKNVIFPEWWTFVPLAFVFALLALEFGVRILTGHRQQDDQGSRL